MLIEVEGFDRGVLPDDLGALLRLHQILNSGALMSTGQTAKQLHALCHEHHLEMRMNGAADPEYACPKPDCAVRYTPSNGYFIAAKQGPLELDILPRRRCPSDGQAMYLAEVDPGKRGFRLWRCPQCDSSRTNEEDLIIT